MNKINACYFTRMYKTMCSRILIFICSCTFKTCVHATTNVICHYFRDSTPIHKVDGLYSIILILLETLKIQTFILRKNNWHSIDVGKLKLKLFCSASTL